MTPSEYLLDVQGLRITGPAGELVHDINLSIEAGQTLGIVGESGSGKSLTAAAIMGLLPERLNAEGSVRWRGTELLGQSEKQLRTVRGSGIAMMLQDPFTALHPRMRAGDSIVEGLRNPDGSRLTRAQARAEAVRRLAEVGIDDVGAADRYPFQLSGGMLQRIALAATLARDPDLLIADEPTTALDVTTQAEILDLIGRIQRERGMAVIFITHDLRMAFSICERVKVFYAGSCVEDAPSRALEHQPLHPYSLGLINSLPPAHGRPVVLSGIPGTVPPPSEVTDRCRFSSRCDWATDACRDGEPALRPVGEGRTSRCVRIEEIRDAMSSRTQVPLELATSGAERTAEPVLTVSAATKTFNSGARGAKQVLKGIDLVVHPGESVGLVGESGSGKSTLGRCIVGLEQADGGSIVVDGTDVTDRSRMARGARAGAFKLAQMVFQDPKSSLDPTQSIGDGMHQLLARMDVPRSGRDMAATELLERVGLTGAYLQRYPRHLSGGQRQRVAIARALTANPRLLVCDEPVSALDVSIQAQILNLFNDIREAGDVSLLFISHDLAVVRQVVDRVYVMYHGEIVEEGEVNEVFDHPRHPYTQRLVGSVIGGTAA